VKDESVQPGTTEAEAIDFAIVAASLHIGGNMRQAADAIDAFLRSLPDAGTNRCAEGWLNGWSLHGLAQAVKERGRVRR
jgi:hypothetical protein